MNRKEDSVIVHLDPIPRFNENEFTPQSGINGRINIREDEVHIMPIERTRIDTAITDYEGWWRGQFHSGGDFYLHHAIFELIDNGLSHSLYPSTGWRPTNPTIEVIIYENGYAENDHKLIINDNGVGISAQIFTDVLLKLGSRPQNPSKLSEHGFGLKNALSYIQEGNLRQFEIFSKSDDGIGKIVGPYREGMYLEPATEEEWNQYVQSEWLRRNRSFGTTIVTPLSHNILKTLGYGSRRGSHPTNFTSLIERLQEHIMITYRKFLAAEATLRIFVFNKPLGGGVNTGSQLFTQSDGSIRKWEHEYESLTQRKKTISVEVGNKRSDVTVTIGEAPFDSKEHGNYSALKHYYPLTSAKVGIDLFVRGRLVKDCEFVNIWENEPDYSNNWLIGEIELDENFDTRNNKTNVNHSSEMWRQVVEKIRDPVNAVVLPSSHAAGVHNNILQFLKKKWESGGTIQTTAIKINETKVFEDNLIDLWYEEMREGDIPNIIHIYELKEKRAKALDVYQLKMYCDGFLHKFEDTTGKQIKLHLLAQTFSRGAYASRNFIVQKLRDSNGKAYQIQFDKFTEELTPNGKISDIEIKVNQ